MSGSVPVLVWKKEGSERGGMATSDMVVPAVKAVMWKNTTEEIDCLIVGTVTPDHVFPASRYYADKLRNPKMPGDLICLLLFRILYSLTIGGLRIPIKWVPSLIILTGPPVSLQWWCRSSFTGTKWRRLGHSGFYSTSDGSGCQFLHMKAGG